MKIEHKVFNFDVHETKQIERDGVNIGIIRGFLATYGNTDRVGDTIAQGAFSKSIERHKKDNRSIRMFYNHNRKNLPLGGFPIHLVEDRPKGLFVEGEIVLDTTMGADVYALVKAKHLSDMSIGFSIVDAEMVEDVRVLKELELWEGSIVDEPANAEAKITEVKSFDIEQVQDVKTKREFEKLMRDAGFSQKAAKYLTANYCEQRDDVGEIEAEKLKSLEAEQAAIAAIRGALASFK